MIDNNLYQQRRKLEDLRGNLTPYSDYLEKQVPYLEDLLIFYQHSDGKVKRRILDCLFTQKLHFEEGKVATPQYTYPIFLLLNISKALRGDKNKKEVYKDLLSNMAPPANESYNFNSIIEYIILHKSRSQNIKI